MKSYWTRFEKWLASNAPHLLTQLNDGATEADIEKLQSVIEVRLPNDFVQFYKIHNGQAHESEGLIKSEQLLSIDQIIRQWQNWDSLLAEFQDEDGRFTSDPDEGIKNDWWNPLWVPFTNDGSGNHICIDLNPDSTGTFGQVIQMWHDADNRELYARSFTEWFDSYVTGLENGQFVYAKRWGLVDKDSVFNKNQDK